MKPNLPITIKLSPQEVSDALLQATAVKLGLTGSYRLFGYISIFSEGQAEVTIQETSALPPQPPQ